MTDDLPEWIRGLADSNLPVRNAAAARIYDRGVRSAESVLGALRPLPEFRELIHNLQKGADPKGRSGPPRLIVGVAVQPQNFEKIRAANGSPRLADVPPDQDAIEFELQFANHVELDILTIRDPDGNGAIAKFLKKFGEGIQQVELYVRDVDRGTEILRTRMGLQPIYPATRPGANRTRVNFFLVPTSDGGKLLLELVQDPA